LKQKQPKTYVGISAVGGKGILQRSRTVEITLYEGEHDFGAFV